MFKSIPSELPKSIFATHFNSRIIDFFIFFVLISIHIIITL